MFTNTNVTLLLEHIMVLVLLYLWMTVCSLVHYVHRYSHAMGCYADVTAFLDGKCSGRQSCKVMVGTMDAVAQPCPKDFKSYMEATYTCVPGMEL